MNMTNVMQAPSMKSRALYRIVTLILLLVAGCASTPSHSEGILLHESDSGQILELRVNDTFLILLDSNPSTGYSWNVEYIDLAVLEQVGEPLFTPDSNLPGSGGTTMFAFQTIAVGQTLLRLIYHRTWEEDTPPLKTFEITITITP
jgi:inhibitor of cysteine peptidase